MSFHLNRGLVIGMVAFAGLLLATSAASAQTQYQAVDLSYSGNYGTAINAVSAGQGAGYNIYDVYFIDHVKHYRLHAMYWPAGGAPAVELNPFDSPYSNATAASGRRQAGFASVKVGATYQSHAIVWRGTAASARDITVSGYDNSAAAGIDGNAVVGQASGAATGGYPHAVLWDLKASTITDLNGTGHQDSGAVATSGKQQVGWATDDSGADIHAMLWKGDAASAVDLHPAGFMTSNAYGVDHGHQIGDAQTLSAVHAILWHGTAASAIDLNPAGYLYTYGTGIAGGKQVGFGTKSDFNYHALVWSGRASKVIDLQAFLPSSLVQSYATSIDAAGNIGGWATDKQGVNHAMLWQPLP